MRNLDNHRIVSKDEWLAARSALLKKEKEFTVLRDKLGQQQRDMPWVSVDKEYLFVGPNGKQTLSDLFDGRTQLIVYHFMYDPNWDAGCPSCSFWADNFNGIVVHLNQRDVTMIAVSRAPYSKIEEYKKRMGWNFKWVSSYDNDFNFDYHVSFTPKELSEKKLSTIIICKIHTVQSERELVCSTRKLLTMCFIPIRRIRVALMC